ncbi:MAG: cellulase family glycosylhydrolase [Sphingobacteriales bacterium]|nr:cellulase family glycosylhydrolase [Sphingobacteriales bacterium]
MKLIKPFALLLLFTVMAVEVTTAQSRTVWPEKKANDWYAQQPWLVGCNFSPSTAINQLEMWQAETFDTATINRELGWAASIGMNCVRVFLHDLLYQQDADGFLKRMDIFLAIAQRHHIKVMFVLFDSVWDPFPKLGKQKEPTPHVHNSGWVQSPGVKVLLDSSQYPRLEEYVKSVVKYFKDDGRILAWDVWNEPDNLNPGSYGKYEPKNKGLIVAPLLKKVFVWARTVNPSQPLTSGIWLGDWSTHQKLKIWQKVQLEQSDIISFHNYDAPAELEKRIKQLKRYGRPMLNTEYMSRGNGSFFEGSLPIFKKYNVAAFNWGLVAGKTNTIYPWDSWEKKYTGEPKLWFHDIFRADGTPYKQSEVNFIKKITGEK